MKFSPEQKAEILEKVSQCLDDWELDDFDCQQENVYEDPEKDIYWAIRLCIEDEL